MRSEIVLFSFLLGLCGLVCFAEEQNAVPPITGYRRGYKQRVEYIIAVIRRNNLDTGSPPNSKAKAYSKSMSPYQFDDAGHLIAARLGGTGKETYNIVPHNRAQNRGAWRTRVEAPIYEDVHRGNVVIYEVWPIYSPRATRPSALKYLAKRQNGRVVLSGTMANPIPQRMESFESINDETQESDYFGHLAEQMFDEERRNEEIKNNVTSISEMEARRLIKSYNMQK